MYLHQCASFLTAKLEKVVAAMQSYVPLAQTQKEKLTDMVTLPYQQALSNKISRLLSKEIRALR